MKNSLYHTEVINDEGLNGTAYVKDGASLQTSDPLKDSPGFNPEQLFGLAWSTCLNATIEALLNARGAAARSKVEAHVDFSREDDRKGFYFDLKAYVSVEGMELADVEKLAQSAHNRCPVSKIIGDYNHVTLEVVPYTE
ncbi:organic hydroperoxide reductase OsmC/OhrA [Trichococcus patagoniensis]|uniref:Organic hydroperoxide reductase OsmC/OhrA n=1 Tax=Trichococcus patagoniensis TaxID=382641 RepID=A0A2T5IL54_9LACT|nr:OsmC family protein [Trichococcus patagoniensis]PTQ84539.1 organic hydroperoxide reductase OsmC/OhrA [Trichococcus patagoniensis]